MVATGLAALDSSILATAVPSIVADLGDFAQFPWMFSIYLLAQAVSVPLYAKLADLLGRKPLLLFGIGLFLVASLLCGVAWSMPVLIVARGLQGLGAGAILPMTITIAGDIYTVQERAKIQGYIASVWALSSVIGPTLGGLFCQYLTWRWVFWINLPLGLLAVVLLVRRFHETVVHRTHKIDYTGIVLLTLSLTALILAVLEGGQVWAWDSALSLGLLATGAVGLTVFVLVERRAAEPVLPLWLFSRRLLLTTSLAGFASGAVLLGLTSYIPTFLEKTLGVVPLVAGLSVAAILAGWPLAATFSGRFYLKIGFRLTALLGSSLVVMALAGLLITVGSPSLFWVTLFCFLSGVGFGLSVTPTTIAAQSSVEWEQRGVVTGNAQFARAVGSAIGVSIFGAVANGFLASVPGGETVGANLVGATERVFAVALGIGVLSWLALAAMPKDKPKAAV
jgi:EmrB/QacA subfamily drug resistance transporter